MNPIASSAPLLMATPGAAQDGGSSFVTLGMFALIFVVFYFMIIRPQNKKQKDTQKMIQALKKGDKVQTIGGLRGVIHSTKEDTVLIKVDDDVKLEFVRSAIASVLEQKPVEEAEKVAEKATEITEEKK